MRLPVAGLLLASLACCTASIPDRTEPSQPGISRAVPESIWGNERETLFVFADGARFEGLCVEGRIDGPIVVGDDGAFEASGTFVPKGGARLDAGEKTPVRYRGRVTGEEMELSIQDGERRLLGPTSLRRGVRGGARPCA